MSTIFPNHCAWRLMAAFLLLTVWSCGGGGSEDTAGKTAPPAEEQLTVADLDGYRRFLNSRTPADSMAVVDAATVFRTAFATASPAICDSAYVDFLEFHRGIEDLYNFAIDENRAAYETLLDPDSSAHLPGAVAFRNRLELVGLRFVSEEGFGVAEIDPAFHRRHFYDRVSPTMRTYMDQWAIEQDSPVGTDEHLDLPLAEVAERAIFWERFVAGNPEFILASEALINTSFYQYIFMMGTSQTPAFDNTTQILQPRFRQAFQALLRDHADTQLAEIVSRYYQILQGQNYRFTDKVEEFVNLYSMY